ncbi:MAG: methyltransferase domain-containing protein [Nitrospinae bacterium]|nr:methyltransferase domain-containing protein [Nitrospinota bacterium]
MWPQERMVRAYDRAMRKHARYYDHSGYYNFGYWSEQTRTQKEACENLVEMLLDRIPEKRGAILDVACGLGATTRHLLNYYDPKDVVAINISDAQLACAQQYAPGCTFQIMDAARLDLPDASVENVICVEAAFHFETRDRFLREVHRVLKPGGHLVLSDILFRTVFRPIAKFMQVPRANLISDPQLYAGRLADAGFEHVRVDEETRSSLSEFRHYIVRWPGKEWQAGRMSLRSCIKATLVCWAISTCFGVIIKHYLVASARKRFDRIV